MRKRQAVHGMSDTAFWVVIVSFGCMGILLIATLLIWVYEKGQRYGSQRITLSDMYEIRKREYIRRAKELSGVVDQQVMISQEILKIQEQGPRYQEIQCQGCGYLHVYNKCPKCKRQRANKVEWVTQGR